MDFTQYNPKVALLLEKLLKPEFQIKNEDYLKKLLGYFEGSLQYHEIIVDWLRKLVDALIAEGSTSGNMKTFALNLASLLSRYEDKFITLNNDDVYDKLLAFTSARNFEAPPDIKKAYIKLLYNLLDHKSGINLIFAHNFWEDIVVIAVSQQPPCVREEGCHFIKKILEKTSENERLNFRIIERVTQPIYEKIPDVLRDNCDKFERTCDLIGDILEHLLGKLDNQSILKVIERLTPINLIRRVVDLMAATKSQTVLFYLSRIALTQYFIDCYLECSSKCTHNLKNDRKISDLYLANVSKGFAENAVKLCYIGWKLIHIVIKKTEIPLIMDRYKCDDQFLILQGIPCIVIIKKYCYNKKQFSSPNDDDDLRDDFMQTLFKIAHPTTWRIITNWRDYAMDLESNLFEIAAINFNYIEKSKKIYNREQASFLFKALVYTLKDIITFIQRDPENLELIIKEYKYVSKHLQTIGELIEDFQITWRDSIETTCVMRLSYEILQVPSWHTEVVVSTIKLIEIAVRKYMTTNMALLLDCVPDETMQLIMPLLLTKLQDSSWEIQQATLELLGSIANVSKTKFPPLQKFLLESNLPNLILNLAIGEGNLITASALKALQQLVQVDEVWTTILKRHNLHQKMCEILHNEDQGIVRVEAAAVISIIYVSHPEILDDVYETMYHAVTTDLCGQVKIKALEFWDSVMKQCLQNQGMIDGTFPEVTFSKENRKIVNLTEVEIQKRLMKILKQLSDLGCLAVLMTAIQDDCDIEIIKYAVNITAKFIKLLQKYNIRSSNYEAPFSPSTSSSGFCSSNTSNSNRSEFNNEDFVFDSKSPSNRGSNAPSENGTGSINDYLELKKFVSVEEFLIFCNTDLEALLKLKTGWRKNVEDFDSLVDEILSNDRDYCRMECS